MDSSAWFENLECGNYTHLTNLYEGTRAKNEKRRNCCGNVTNIFYNFPLSLVFLQTRLKEMQPLSPCVDDM